jgi:type IV secretion system protein VirB9
MELRSLFYIPVFLVLSVASTCFALEIPKSAGGDERIKKVVYNKNEVVRVNAFVGIGTQIVFAEDEEVKDYGSGFSDGYLKSEATACI